MRMVSKEKSSHQHVGNICMSIWLWPVNLQVQRCDPQASTKAKLTVLPACVFFLWGRGSLTIVPKTILPGSERTQVLEALGFSLPTMDDNQPPLALFNVKVGSGPISKPMILEISCQWRSRKPGLHKAWSNGTFSWQSLMALLFERYKPRKASLVDGLLNIQVNFGKTR